MTEEIVYKVLDEGFKIGYNITPSYIFMKLFNKLPLVFDLEDLIDVKEGEEVEANEHETYKNLSEANLGVKFFMGDKEYLVTDDTMFLKTDFSFWILGYDKELIIKNYNKYFSFKSIEEMPRIQFFTGFDDGGYPCFSTREVKALDSEDIFSHYNKDLPHNELMKALQTEDSGLFLLHGKPGTGKTYYLRYLISELKKDCKFIYFSGTDFMKIVNNKKALFEIDNGIIIIEDCEDILKSRDMNPTGVISDLLNICDGILGDGLNFKIICTFNTNLRNIDSALTRKGRIKLKYEFKDLEEERATQLKNKLGVNVKSNVLCDILNPDSTGVVETKTETRIGF